MIKFLAQNDKGHVVNSAWEATHFPAGEAHIKVSEETVETPFAAYVTGTNMDDYVLLGQWADIAHQDGFTAHAMIPYLPGARADRGKPFGAKVYADIINSFNLDSVVCFDPHSKVMPSLINNIKIVHSDIVIKDAIADLDQYVGVICPDQGATERTERVANTLGLPVFYAKKHRDFETGKLSGFECEDVPEEGRLLVVDDICDGGGTFMGLASVINADRERLTLWVSHGVFSGKANELNKYFGRIYTTDSYPNARREDVGAEVVNLLPYLVTEINNQNKKEGN